MSNEVFCKSDLLSVGDFLVSTAPWDLTFLKILFAFYLTLNLLMFQNTKIASYYFKSLFSSIGVLLCVLEILGFSKPIDFFWSLKLVFVIFMVFLILQNSLFYSLIKYLLGMCVKHYQREEI